VIMDWLVGLAVIVGWLVLQVVVLPRLGVAT
jgi:hypothetical protein